MASCWAQNPAQDKQLQAWGRGVPSRGTTLQQEPWWPQLAASQCVSRGGGSNAVGWGPLPLCQGDPRPVSCLASEVLTTR